MLSFHPLAFLYLTHFFLLKVSALPVEHSPIVRRDPAWQQIPPTAQKAPGHFNTDVPQETGEPPNTASIPDDVYGARTIDIPFSRLYHGNMTFFSLGELNVPTSNKDLYNPIYDNANESACGIPDNAFYGSKVAIHPYFLKFADLSRDHSYPKILWRRKKRSYADTVVIQVTACKTSASLSGSPMVLPI